MSVDWIRVAGNLDVLARAETWGVQITPTDGQRRTLCAVAERLRLGRRSLLLADEVGMGKTLIAAALIDAVRQAGGRSAVVIPPGLGAQWQSELRLLRSEDQTLAPLRSYRSFIDGFARAEDLADRPTMRERRKRELADRRLQRQLPEGDWQEETVLLLSHNFGKMGRVGSAVAEQRALVEAVLKTEAGTRRYRRNPKTGSHHNVARHAANQIMASLRPDKKEHLIRALKNGDDLSQKARVIVASGLGQFDLMVVDETHKSRGEESMLSHVLGNMTWKAKDVFRLGMTATPVELNAGQWIDTLARLAVPPAVLAPLSSAITNYADAIDRLRHREALTEQSVEAFREVAERFHHALSPWVLRRDKREDAFLREFCARFESHRTVKPVFVEFGNMGLDWKRAFLTTEALSLLTEHNLSARDRRARLALPDGRGLDALDSTIDDTPSKPVHAQLETPWSALAENILVSRRAAIFSHPAIVRAVEEIEKWVVQGHKVLVFGRFKRPMRALTFLLDSREMVRRLCGENVAQNRWPQSTVGKLNTERRAALEAALADPGVNTDGLARRNVEIRLREYAARHDADRKSNLDMLEVALRNRLETADDADAEALLNRWRPRVGSAAVQVSSSLLLAALEDQRPLNDLGQAWTTENFIEAYRCLISEVAGKSDGDGSEENFESRLKEHLEVFGGREGHFARRMDGDTAPQTRLLLQAAFNREHAWPQVLVAQSTVGREGLNLHSACRVVLMLHLEWNPAHAEQQIGRVDRIASLWSQDAQRFLSNPSVGQEIPKIEVRPLVVAGTYDAHHWAVLKERWESMRAQLNGEMLPDVDCDVNDHQRRELIDRARRSGPSFAPPPCR